MTVSASGDTLVIEPFNNTQVWKVVAPVNLEYCNATIDFNVPGKPGPPPVKLTASYFLAVAPMRSPGMNVILFSDPSGKLASPTMPLNTWVELTGSI